MIYVEIRTGEEQLFSGEINKVRINDVKVDDIVSGYNFDLTRAGSLLAEFLSNSRDFLSISLKDQESTIIVNKHKITKARIWKTDY